MSNEHAVTRDSAGRPDVATRKNIIQYIEDHECVNGKPWHGAFSRAAKEFPSINATFIRQIWDAYILTGTVAAPKKGRRHKLPVASSDEWKFHLRSNITILTRQPAATKGSNTALDPSTINERDAVLSNVKRILNRCVKLASQVGPHIVAHEDLLQQCRAAYAMVQALESVVLGAPTTTPSATTPAATTPAATIPAAATAATSPAATSPAATSPATTTTTPAATSPVAATPAATSPVATSPAATSPVATSPATTATNPATTTPATTTMTMTPVATTVTSATRATTTAVPIDALELGTDALGLLANVAAITSDAAVAVPEPLSPTIEQRNTSSFLFYHKDKQQSGGAGKRKSSRNAGKVHKKARN